MGPTAILVTLVLVSVGHGQVMNDDPDSDRILDGGDTMMSKEQYDMFYGTNETRSKRKAWGQDDKFRWTNGIIPYEFDPNGAYTDKHKQGIRKAMDTFERETCLKFVPARPENRAKIVFVNGGSCMADLGMTGRRQTVTLQNPTCRHSGLYFHEIGHAIGLVHEHQLPDRDNYIRIQWRNVLPHMRRWFGKYKHSEVNRFGIPFDLSSVMHYEINSFTDESGGQSIKVIDRNKEHYISKVFLKMLSFTDVKVINKMYKCDARCRGVSCPQEGFLDKHCRCITPQSYYDSHCSNESPEAECLEIVRSDKCRYSEFFFKCRKACDGCPKFGITFPHQRGSCFNRYYDDRQCDIWARDNSCTHPTYMGWMRSWCIRSCNACGKADKCANLRGDQTCNTLKEHKYCRINKQNVWSQCADACDTCGYAAKSIECSNEHNDADCQARATKGDCDEPGTAVWMKTNCASSCHSCGFNKGQCRNTYDDATCERRAALDGACFSDIVDMHTNCGKTCNTCAFKNEGNCMNFKSDKNCDFFKKDGHCSSNPGVFKLYCQKSCNSCGYPHGRCENQKANALCEKWKGWKHCVTNPEFVKFNCPATCQACNIITLGDYCEDIQTPEYCEAMKARGDCDHANMPAELKCRRTCNLCGAPLQGAKENKRG